MVPGPAIRKTAPRWLFLGPSRRTGAALLTNGAGCNGFSTCESRGADSATASEEDARPKFSGLRRPTRSKSTAAVRGRSAANEFGVGHRSSVEFVSAAVFKVLSTHSEPYYTMPWSTSPQTTSAASAFALALDGERFLLTNAHAVHHASVVELQRPGEGTKHLAQVVCSGPDCDLALLDIREDESFWDGVTPLELCRDLPLLNDSVRVCGYPVGGENACITQGVVSRVDLQPYQHGLSSLLAIQIDAAINPGNSGGPAIDTRQRCIGVAFQSLKDGDTENIGYVIPSEIIEQFLRGYRRHGRYVGFGYCGFAWQLLDNRALREAVGAVHGGVLVKRVEPLSPAAGLLQRHDVLMSIGGKQIGSGGTVHFRRRERIAFPYVARRLCPGDNIDMQILRAGALQTFSLRLAWHSPLVQMHPPQPPAYVIFGGLVFVPLSEPYLRSEWGDVFEERAPVALVTPWLYNVRQAHGEEVVVLSCVLGSALTAGLTHFANRRLFKCGGRRIRNLAHLARILDESTDEYLHFEIDDDDIIVLPRVLAHEATAHVLQAHFIPSSRSLPPIRPGEADDLPPSLADSMDARHGFASTS